VPVTYVIDKTKGLILTRCVSGVTPEEVIEHFRALENDAECPDQLDVLLDLCEQTSIPTGDELRRVVREIRRVRGAVRFRACAIIACSDALFGMLRMFEVFAEKHFTQTRVFRTSGEAEDWLASQTPKTSSAGN
jgi:hypothetical protein